MPGNGKVRMKIVIQRDTHPFVISSPLENENILGCFHSDIRNVNRVEAMSAENRRRVRARPWSSKTRLTPRD